MSSLLGAAASMSSYHTCLKSNFLTSLYKKCLFRDSTEEVLVKFAATLPPIYSKVFVYRQNRVVVDVWQGGSKLKDEY